MKILKEKLESNGFTVDTLGLFGADAADIKSSDAVILPVPTTKDKKTVFAPLTNRRIYLEDLATALSSNQLVLCCNYTFGTKNCVNYGALDSYALLNAVPTAEGAIKIAIENTPFTLWKSRVLVIGFGRVGKVLSGRLKAMECDVTVSARKSADFALINAMGLKYINTTLLREGVLPFDIVFNTVDAEVLDGYTFKRSKCALAIDLSSKGGFDLSAAESAGVKAIFAGGLPAKVAPHTAAEILFKTVTEIINDR